MRAAPPTPAGQTVPGPTGGGGRALAVAQGVRFVVRAGGAMGLARLLAPADYGRFGMAAIVYGLLFLVRDLGAGAAVPQPGLTPAQFRAMCRFGVIGGLVIGLVCAATGPIAAWFYAEPRLTLLLAALALAFPFAGAAAPRVALCYREGHAGRAALIDTVALLGSTLLAVAAAFAGAGAWALVLLAVAGEVITCALAVRLCPWHSDTADAAPLPWRRLLGFGAQLSVHNVAQYFQRASDQIVVGRVAGADALGVYGRGVQATALPAQFTVAPFTAWIVAELARVAGDGLAYRARFRALLNGVMHLTLPAAAVCVAVPELVVGVLFGERWAGAVPVVRWLGLGLALQPWLFVPTWLLISSGRTRRLALLGLLGLVITAVAVWSQRQGAGEQMAQAMAVAALVVAATTVPLAVAASPAAMGDVVTASARPLILNVGLGLVLAAAQHAGRPTLGGQLGVAVGAALLYLGLAFTVAKGVRREWLGHFLWRA
ncbi:oligosaccharide flippase family protein [Opitutus sp. ER46]|uniref:oligosaccharide flippase family protein n=1 Tax=Opitutus sp. ER46 TaxID=2161864 RepID=UPI001304A2F3|nr:oligosaccharide flippase family protein [Opitutus sp. ER46]